MPPLVSEWSNLVLRWVHVVAAILWFGQAWAFVKISRLYATGEASGASAPPWLFQEDVFYVAERRGVQKLLPAKGLSFFHEALATWISGFLLLGLLYYSDGLLLADHASIGMGAGVGIGIAVLFVGWIVYDLLWISPLGHVTAVPGLICYGLLVALAYGLVQIFSGRAAYIEIGALLGTVLTLNVVMRMVPAQRKLRAAAAEGRPLDSALLARVRTRSRHNLLLVIPTVFLMISNHFPLATYGQSENWLILAALVLVGIVAGKIVFRV